MPTTKIHSIELARTRKESVEYHQKSFITLVSWLLRNGYEDYLSVTKGQCNVAGYLAGVSFPGKYLTIYDLAIDPYLKVETSFAMMALFRMSAYYGYDFTRDISGFGSGLESLSSTLGCDMVGAFESGCATSMIQGVVGLCGKSNQEAPRIHISPSSHDNEMLQFLMDVAPHGPGRHGCRVGQGVELELSCGPDPHLFSSVSVTTQNDLLEESLGYFLRKYVGSSRFQYSLPSDGKHMFWHLYNDAARGSWNPPEDHAGEGIAAIRTRVLHKWGTPGGCMDGTDTMVRYSNDMFVITSNDPVVLEYFSKHTRLTDVGPYQMVAIRKSNVVITRVLEDLIDLSPDVGSMGFFLWYEEALAGLDRAMGMLLSGIQLSEFGVEYTLEGGFNLSIQTSNRTAAGLFRQFLVEKNYNRTVSVFKFPFRSIVTGRLPSKSVHGLLLLGESKPCLEESHVRDIVEFLQWLVPTVTESGPDSGWTQVWSGSVLVRVYTSDPVVQAKLASLFHIETSPTGVHMFEGQVPRNASPYLELMLGHAANACLSMFPYLRDLQEVDGGRAQCVVDAYRVYLFHGNALSVTTYTDPVTGEKVNFGAPPTHAMGSLTKQEIVIRLSDDMGRIAQYLNRLPDPRSRCAAQSMMEMLLYPFRNNTLGIRVLHKFKSGDMEAIWQAFIGVLRQDYDPDPRVYPGLCNNVASISRSSVSDTTPFLSPVNDHGLALVQVRQPNLSGQFLLDIWLGRAQGTALGQMLALLANIRGTFPLAGYTEESRVRTLSWYDSHRSLDLEYARMLVSVVSKLYRTVQEEAFMSHTNMQIFQFLRDLFLGYLEMAALSFGGHEGRAVAHYLRHGPHDWEDTAYGMEDNDMLVELHHRLGCRYPTEVLTGVSRLLGHGNVFNSVMASWVDLDMENRARVAAVGLLLDDMMDKNASRQQVLRVVWYQLSCNCRNNYTQIIPLANAVLEHTKGWYKGDLKFYLEAFLHVHTTTTMVLYRILTVEKFIPRDLVEELVYVASAGLVSPPGVPLPGERTHTEQMLENTRFNWDHTMLHLVGWLYDQELGKHRKRHKQLDLHDWRVFAYNGCNPESVQVMEHVVDMAFRSSLKGPDLPEGIEEPVPVIESQRDRELYKRLVKEYPALGYVSGTLANMGYRNAVSMAVSAYTSRWPEFVRRGARYIKPVEGLYAYMARDCVNELVQRLFPEGPLNEMERLCFSPHMQWLWAGALAADQLCRCNELAVTTAMSLCEACEEAQPRSLRTVLASYLTYLAARVANGSKHLPKGYYPEHRDQLDSPRLSKETYQLYGATTPSRKKGMRELVVYLQHNSGTDTEYIDWETFLVQCHHAVPENVSAEGVLDRFDVITL
jgi:hypothetical protein